MQDSYYEILKKSYTTVNVHKKCDSINDLIEDFFLMKKHDRSDYEKKKLVVNVMAVIRNLLKKKEYSFNKK